MRVGSELSQAARHTGEAYEHLLNRVSRVLAGTGTPERETEELARTRFIDLFEHAHVAGYQLCERCVKAVVFGDAAHSDICH